MSTTTEPTVRPEMAEIVELCKRRGFVFPSADIYGGIRSSYDYGPHGVALLNNVRDQWWKSMVQYRDDVVGLEASILGPPAVWEASGHLSNFSDPLVECTACNTRHREDHLEDPNTCPACGATGTLSSPRQFNLMFKTHAGPVEGAGHEVYLRPETAQGMFINYELVRNANRLRLPFGIAQVGKSFRNEITPGNFVFRTREFVQMEMEFFVPPADAATWHEYWLNERMAWYQDLGISPDLLRLRAHEADELSHYSAGTSDVEFHFPFGWGELEGIANRGDYDLTQHQKHSGARLDYLDPDTGERFTPHVIEPAAGATRAAMAFLIAAWDRDEVKGEARDVLRFDPRLAPVKVAVLPLSKKPELIEVSHKLTLDLKRRWATEHDVTQSIGRRYRRQDEIGTPLSVTIDFETLDDDAVTVRDRDTLEQARVPLAGLTRYLDNHLGVL
jgi:glycyl-tRNA synthetase